MAAIEQENSYGENGSGRRAGTTKAGDPCRSRPAPGRDYCLFHGEDHEEVSKRGGEVSAARRSVRDRLREDAERIYDSLFRSLEEAIESEVVKWGDCPECGYKVRVTFSDIRARTQAIQVLLDQGCGKPALSVRHELDTVTNSPFDTPSEADKELAISAARARLATLSGSNGT